MHTITGQYLSQYPKFRLGHEYTPRHVHRERKSHALAIWTAIAAASWLLALVRVW